jgi:hypothetical protein
LFGYGFSRAQLDAALLTPGAQIADDRYRIVLLRSDKDANPIEFQC